MDKGEELKLRILDIVKRSGPVLPAQISKETGRDTFFAGAVLSDLMREKKVFSSSAKIGGSSVYYVQGQEARLDVLFSYLPLKEKEAYALLKQHQLLRDIELEPSIRVALRNLKDFAVPVTVQVNKQGELFWKWHLTPDSEAERIVLSTYIEQPQAASPAPAELQSSLPVSLEKKKTSDSLFSQQVVDYLKERKIQIIKEESVKKNKDLELIVQIPSEAGMLTYYLVAKNKKKISDADLMLAYNKAHGKKMPLFFITSGELAKKTQHNLQQDLKGIVVHTFSSKTL